MGAKIKLMADGPMQVSGTPLVLIDPPGNRYEVPEGKDLFLCRCGSSHDKPYCDGSHKTAGFRASDAARQP